MKTALLWLLIVVSDGHYNKGTTNVLERFTDVEQCEHVRKNIPGDVRSKCVQSKVVIGG